MGEFLERVSGNANREGRVVIHVSLGSSISKNVRKLFLRIEKV